LQTEQDFQSSAASGSGARNASAVAFDARTTHESRHGACDERASDVPGSADEAWDVCASQCGRDFPYNAVFFLVAHGRSDWRHLFRFLPSTVSVPNCAGAAGGKRTFTDDCFTRHARDETHHKLR
jgi:hypothetical protein